MYLPRHEYSEELRTRLLTNARNHAIAQGRSDVPSLTVLQNQLSSDDIEVIQQVALWQFTNYDQRTNALSPIINPTITSMRAIANMLITHDVSDNPINNGAEPRKDAIEVLFYYLVEGARANNATAIQPVVTPSVSFGNTSPEIEVVSPTPFQDYYVIGPFSITGTGGFNDPRVNFNISGVLQTRRGAFVLPDINIPGTPGVRILNASGTLMPETTTLENMINAGNFYVRFPSLPIRDNIDDAQFTINYTYTYWTTTEASYWEDQDNPNSEQPVVIIDKERESGSGSSSIGTGDPEGRFNLRITKADSEGRPITNNRARFIVTRMPAGGATTHETGNDGIVNLPSIDIETAGQVFEFRIEEAVAPQGFVRLYNPFYVRVVTALVEGEFNVIRVYTRPNATAQWVLAPNNTIPGVAVTRNGNLIEIVVRNEEIPGGFDLALRKFITAINGVEPEVSRVPSLDLSPLRNNTGTTAIYTHPKDPLVVRQGDIILYTIRVYNEGEIDGFANTITDHLPAGLGFLPNHSVNLNNQWQLPSTPGISERRITPTGDNAHLARVIDLDDFEITENREISLNDVEIIPGRIAVTTNRLEYDATGSNLIRAYDPDRAVNDIPGAQWQQTDETGYSDGLFYREVQIAAIVLAPNTYRGVLRNIAEITTTQDEDGNDNSDQDRDSTPGNVDTENYNPPADNSSYQEDDDDYEQVTLRYFDLALRKFITTIYENDRDTTGRQPNSSREPVVTIPPGFATGDTTDLIYTHDKTPVLVANGNIVVYTIRVFNEGTMAGFAAEIRDDLPEGIEFLPSHPINVRYEWRMVDEEGETVTNVSDAYEVRTRYLSHENHSETRNNLLAPFDLERGIVTPPAGRNPDFRDVQIAFRVVERELPENSNRVIINTAEITENEDEDGNEVEDIDSTPDNDVPEEDDQDTEYIRVKYFDLALLKWVSQTIVTIDGRTTTTNHQMPHDDPWSEYLVRIPALRRNQIRNARVDVIYTIRILNVGQIAGTATEVRDILPPQMEFIQSYNPLWEPAGRHGPTGREMVATRQLEGELIQPGEYRDITIRLRWRNSDNNLGRIQNIALIYEYWNPPGAPDIDRDNEEDDAWVILTPPEGGAVAAYVQLTTGVITILAVGLFLIKRYVLI